MRNVMSKLNRLPKTEGCNPKRAVGFVAGPVLPGENQEEFASLLEDLHKQYGPEGPVEEETVRTIASAIWRKRNLESFQRAFEARMKWGSYFEYPGDPEGFAKITREDSQRIDAMTAKFIEKMVEEKLAGPGPDSREKMKKVAVIAESETGSTKAANGITKSSDLPEGPLKRMFENAIAEIKASGTAKTNRKASHTTSVEDRARIVRKVVQIEMETEKARAAKEAPRPIREQIKMMLDAFENALAAMEMGFGPAIVEEALEEMCCRATEHSLAKLGDLLTPENYIDELHFNEVLDQTIERAHDRLMKYQASRARRSAANVNSLQPGWVARKHWRSPNHNIRGDA
jgi:hypothetical protein